MITLIVAFVSAGVGFGLGRVKNKAKLAAVQAELNKVKSETLALSVEEFAKVHAVVARIESKL